MGDKGAKQTEIAAAAAAALVEDLSEIGEVTSKSMFGGHGVFSSGVMFAIVDPTGAEFLRFGPANEAAFDEAGAPRHGRMPYAKIPPDVRSHNDELVEWARESLAIATAAKKQTKKK